MAASMRCRATLVSQRISSFKFKASSLHTAVSLNQSSLPSLNDGDEVVYPPIKPKYPPGQWGEIPPSRAWKIDEKAEELLQVPSVKMRLETIAGPYDGKKPYFFGMNLCDVMPGTLNYKQYITKTHVVEKLPDIYNKNIDKTSVETATDRLKPLFEDAILHEVDQCYFTLEQNPHTTQAEEQVYFGARLMGRLVSIVQAGLASSVPHLHRAQFDEDVRVETFWNRSGYDGDFATHGTKLGDVLDFQLKYRAAHQIRTELPLPEILPVEDELCQTGNYAEFRYNPKAAGQLFCQERPISVPGHWVGDPCEFNLLSVVLPDVRYTEYIKNHGEHYIDTDSLGWGITAGFGSTVSQAYNQGFFPWVDITYPFIAQTMITDGQWFRFFAYQLNTIHLWKDDEANPTRNIMWASPRLKLYETVEDSRVKGMNDEVLNLIIKCVMLEPQDRGVDLRPYLPDEAAPILTKKLINHIGEEPIPQHKIGRFEYPRNALYF